MCKWNRAGGALARSHLARAACLAALLLFTARAPRAQNAPAIKPLDAPIGATVSEESRQVCPGVRHIHRVTDDPLNLHILIVDLTEPGVALRTCLARDRATGIETVRSMATRKGAVAAVNGDYWSPFGVPQGLTVVDGEIIIAPKFRTAFGVTWEGEPVIGRWTDGWSWQAEAIAPGGARHPISLLNSDLNPGWLCLYTDKFGMLSKGDSAGTPSMELILNIERRVIEMRENQPGREIPSGGFALTGVGAPAEWLREHFQVGDLAAFDLKSTRPWQNLRHAIGAGPRILAEGQFYADPIKEFPEGEEFTLSWKRSHYQLRQPRTALGISREKQRVILITADGRQPQFSIGVSPRHMADLLREFGAWDGMDLDSGGSTTMVIQGELMNHPSDRARADGSGGTEREVCNALLVMYDAPGGPRDAPGAVSKEQHELNIKY